MSEWRESVREDALSQGLPPDVAEYIAEEVGRQVGPHIQRAERIERMVWLFGGPPSLAVELTASTAPLGAIASLLARHTGAARRLSAAGVESCRMSLLQRSLTWGDHP